ncbi:type III secretion system domain-containing protein [Obesumbacterium proteus]|uniref:type III secretion system domain-containing protein n=1 Tax=Obesumbacterium proteus TaxID=82983 RepID=UPI0024321190|nr:type III secretion system domain-containing protein [Obesumbacterium proteus]
MVNLASVAFDTCVNSGDFGSHSPDVDDVAQKAITTCIVDDAALRLHRYLWTPARYAHPQWLAALGFSPKGSWRYGEYPQLDRSLNLALQRRRGTPRLPAQLSDRQRRMAKMVSNINVFVLAIGLLKLECNDYFLLPDYRQLILRWLDEALIWQLFGLCQGRNRAVFSPSEMIDNAFTLGIAVLHRAAQEDAVLYAMLITLPPCKRALWPSIPRLAMNLLERTLCAKYR